MPCRIFGESLLAKKPILFFGRSLIDVPSPLAGVNQMAAGDELPGVLERKRFNRTLLGCSTAASVAGDSGCVEPKSHSCAAQQLHVRGGAGILTIGRHGSTQLAAKSKISGWRDLNPRPLEPHFYLLTCLLVLRSVPV